jgi:hypothetical protein
MNKAPNHALQRIRSVMNIEDKTPDVRLETSPKRMSTRWWLFLVILWSVVLVKAAPLFLLPARETRNSVLLPAVGVDSVSIIETKPILDWLGRHKRYALEVVRHGKTTKVAWPNGSWGVRVIPDGVELTSLDGTVILLPNTTAK